MHVANIFSTPKNTPCTQCQWFKGWAYCTVAGEQVDGLLARCGRDGRTHVHATPDHGCVFWRQQLDEQRSVDSPA